MWQIIVTVFGQDGGKRMGVVGNAEIVAGVRWCRPAEAGPACPKNEDPGSKIEDGGWRMEDGGPCAIVSVAAFAASGIRD